MIIGSRTPSPSSAALVVAERQLVLLGELVAVAIDVSQAFAASAKASAKAEEMILAEEYFVPEVGRAKACGARDAADSFQKIYRAVRLTFKMELAVAEMVDALREGRAAPARDAGETPAVLAGAVVLDRGRLAGSVLVDDAPDRDRELHDSDRDCLVEFERPDTFRAAPFRETVEEICDDLGATVDWKDWRVEAPALEAQVAPEPLDERREVLAETEPETALPP
jgi:hypothetical protein